MKSLAKLIECIALSFLSLSVLSCNSEKKAADNIIDIAAALDKARIVDLSEIAEDITYIPLETTDSSLVGLLSGAGCMLEFEKELIYIWDSQQIIKIFDKNGKFLRAIDHQGRGPHEYLSTSKPSVDPMNGNIMIPCGSSIYEYTDKGSFVRKVITPQKVVWFSALPSFYKIGENRYIMNVFDKTGNSKICAIVYDSLSKTVAQLPTPSFQIPEETASSAIMVSSDNGKNNSNKQEQIIRNLDMRFYLYKNQPRIAMVKAGYILSLNENNIADTLYKTDVGKYKITSENREKALKKDSKFISLRNFLLESENYLFFNLILRGLNNDPLIEETTKLMYRDSYALYDKQSEKVTIMHMPLKDKLGFRDNLAGGPPFWPKSISNDGKTLVGFISALDLKLYAEENDCSERIKALAAKLKDEDNHVVILVKLRKSDK